MLVKVSVYLMFNLMRFVRGEFAPQSVQPGLAGVRVK